MNKKEAAYEEFFSKFKSDISENDKFRSSAQFDANEAEGRMISRYDTFKEEAQFLAAGHEIRKREREGLLAIIQGIRTECLRACNKISSGALFVLEDDDGNEFFYYMIPGGSGKKINIDGQTYVCISPDSSLGRATVGKGVDDDVTIVIERTKKEMVVKNVE